MKKIIKDAVFPEGNGATWFPSCFATVWMRMECVTTEKQAGSAKPPYGECCGRCGWKKHLGLYHHGVQNFFSVVSGLPFMQLDLSKPQKYYNRAAVVTRSGAGSLTLNRPIGATASTPRIEIIGSGTVTLTLEGQTITLTGLVTPPQSGGEYHWPSAVIDCEAMVCYRTGGAGIRTNIDIPQWPQFWQLVHTVSATGGVSRLSIFPRWWAI